ncbi:XRE family transcriptional regulator [Micromonospora fluostatini]|uniref:XRE family transcriptional regulator n=2 Tax=Micromonospora TaxID=1873 RepID=A0ABY2DL79_9ACTN|nr:XRE family transcriptional regulator [Micromonospora fluostatini]
MSQQQFADRLGKSKSWVDKVERGVRRLDKVSVIQEIAEVLRVDPDALVVGDQPDAAQPGGDLADLADLIDDVRAALTRHPGLALCPTTPAPDPGRWRARVVHADAVYGHGRYPALLSLLPGLLDDSHRAAADHRAAVYRLTTLTLVKVGAIDLAWLAADRGLAVAAGTDDPVLAAVAAAPLGQALRAAGRHRHAFETAIVSAHQVVPLDDEGTAAERAACAALLLQAALAAAEQHDPPTVAELLNDAHGMTAPAAPERAAVDAARVAAAAALGDGRHAVDLHEALTAGPGWGLLPLEHRAAHLVDVAPAYALAGDPIGAGRTLLAADRLAPAEVRLRPAGRAALAELLAVGRPDPALLAVAEAAGVDVAR